MRDLFESFLAVSKVPCEEIKFRIDEACLEIISSSSNNLTIWSQSVECDQCSSTPIGIVPPNTNVTILRNSRFPWNFHFTSEDDSKEYCKDTFIHFAEHASYGWNLTRNNCSEIYLKDDSLTQPQYLPILGLFIVLFFSSLVWTLAKCLCNSEWLARSWPRGVSFSELQNDLGSPSLAVDQDAPMARAELSPIRMSPRRVVSLDTFRGISIVVMIFVNYGGGQYWFFKHSPWNGLTVADLVFPWFLWLMGAALALSLRNQLRNCVTRKRLFLRAARRSAFLVAIGIVLATSGGKKTQLDSLRYPGVLQRIGICYFAVATVETILMKPQGSFQYGRWSFIRDVLEAWPQWLIALSFALVHALVSLLVPAPGCPTGYLGPGGLHLSGRFENCTGGIAGYIDRCVFGESHMYQHASCKPIYDTNMAFDPEGILGTLSCVLTVFLGVHAARITMSYNYSSQRITRYLAWAVITGLSAGALCGFSKNDGLIPVNKNLWSLSFALSVSSMAFVAEGVLCFVVDEKSWWSGAPFTFAGMNSLVIYVGHEVTRNMFPWSWQPFYKNHWEFLVMNAWGTALWIIIAWFLHRNKVYVAL